MTIWKDFNAVLYHNFHWKRLTEIISPHCETLAYVSVKIKRSVPTLAALRKTTNWKFACASHVHVNVEPFGKGLNTNWLHVTPNPDTGYYNLYLISVKKDFGALPRVTGEAENGWMDGWMDGRAFRVLASSLEDATALECWDEVWWVKVFPPHNIWSRVA